MAELGIEPRQYRLKDNSDMQNNLTNKKKW